MKLNHWWVALAILVMVSLGPSIARADGVPGQLWQYATRNWVSRVAISGDGQRIAMGSRDNTVHVLDRQGKLLWSFSASNSITGLGMSTDGKWVVVASEDRNVYFFDSTGRLLWKASASRPFNSAAVADDGSLIAGAADDQTVYVYDHDGHQLWTHVAGDQIRALTIYGTGREARIVIGGNDASLRIFSRTGQLLFRTGLDYDVQSVATTPNGARIVVATGNRLVRLLDGSNGKVLWSYATRDDLNGVAISGDGSTVLVGVDGGAAFMLNGAGKLTQTLPGSESALGVAISRDGSTIVLGLADTTAIAIDRPLIQAAAESERSSRQRMLFGLTGALIVGAVACAAFLRLTDRGRRWFAATTKDIADLLAAMWQHRLSYLLLLPTFALLMTFNYYPALSALYHAFTDWQPGIRTTWIGLGNFVALEYDPYFWAGVVNVVIIVLTTLAKTFTVPLFVAELIFAIRSKKAQYWWRTAYVIPLVVPGVALILVWRNILDPTIGLLNEVLTAVGLVRLTHAWLGDPSTALSSIIFIGFPWAAAFPILIFYGGLISIPGELFDSVLVDGASSWHRFWSVDVPLLMSQIKLLLILGIIGGFETFELVFLTTGGGPGSSTYTPALELYYAAMQFDRMGLASAIGILIFVTVLIVTILTMRFIQPATEYEA